MLVNRLCTSQFRGAKLAMVVTATLILGVQTKASPIAVTYSFFNGTFTQPPVFSGNTVTLDAISDGSLLSRNPSLNALWNPLTYHDHSVLDLTTKLLNGTFRITFADGNTLDGMVFEDLTQFDPSTGTGPFTQTLTFSGGTGEFAGATGSLSGAGQGGSVVSGSGTLNAPAIPEPASSALLVSGLTMVLVARRKAKRKRRVNQPCINQFRGTKLALIAAAPIFIASFPISAQAATIPFTFEVTYDAFLNGVPGPTTLTVPAFNSGSGSFAPFGSAIYSSTGTATFAMLPSGDLVLSTVTLNFTASFNGGADTFTGTDFHVTGVSETLTILGGTGMFSGATGFAPATAVSDPPSGNPAPNYVGTITSSGSGQITAPGLTAVPEPATMTLLSISLVGVAALRRRRQSCFG